MSYDYQTEEHDIFSEEDENDICANNHGGQEASEEAFAKLPRAWLRQQVIDYLRIRGEKGATAYETERALGFRACTIGPRFSELKKLNVIERVEKRKTATSWAWAYRLTAYDSPDVL